MASNTIERLYGTPTKKDKRYTCVKCSQVKSEKDFYAPTNSDIWDSTGGLVLVCKNCIINLYDKIEAEYGSQTATVFCCHVCDIAYIDSIYKSCLNKDKKYVFSMYLTKFKSSGFKNHSFAFSVKNREFMDDSDVGINTAKGDSRNQNFVLNCIGYDPFSGTSMSPADKTKAYNMLASYCELPNLEENPHSIQSAIQIVTQQIQIETISDKINQILVSGCCGDDDDKMLSNYITCRKNLQDSVVKLAESSKIAASKMGAENLSKNTLSVKMKEMLEDGVEEAQPNLFTIKWSKACKQVADISNQSILDQLDLQDNEYADMVKKQREMITKQEETLDALAEENRILKNQIIKLGGEVE